MPSAFNDASRPSSDDATRTRAARFAAGFFARQPQAADVIELFRFLPNAYFYAKDAEHRYIAVNHPVLRDVFGLQREDDLLGRTDSDFQPPTLAEAYHQEDRRVMHGGTTIANQVWLVPHIRGTPHWYKSTKTPLRGPDGSVIGLAGVMYPIDTPEEQSQSFRELTPAIRFIEANFTQAVSMKELAELVGLSTTHFNQRFRELLRMTPTQFLLARRVEHARRMLTETEASVSEVSTATGFYDQSHFTKRFRQVTGLTPLAYRKKFRS
ncbi:AraC family transcriptional regulator [Rhodopirellula sallentina]|uniref:AraC family transcriptional regulator n=1 Tax=Rhodopirellula sallentina SM41 TaxID=1263870 RepID=M5UAV2_9BACT|nr:AraC family transcriptional regulator [Rhodopirellula sallentina]EMI58555.1 AraC family transcriptional regulator [Rhodopirellula sallentina SM41]